ncbi:MAG: hypothetical protein LBL36_04520 [Clostridiales Family XIII bacterium]|jgi:putative membrane fusion protein|nr:hypothetical protein [Clostridiales Family XIII bacterium]
MKRSSGIMLVLFLAASVSLFIIIYVMPKIDGSGLETTVLEHENLPVSDTEEVLIIRDETLYASELAGGVSYKQTDGTKVRKGVTVITVDGAAASADGEADAKSANGDIEKVRAAAGGDLAVTTDFAAEETSVVYYSADGYEKKLTPETMLELKSGDIKDVPAAGVSLKTGEVRAGDPVYKLTDNVWYIVFWIDEKSGSRVHYDTGNTVKVDFGDAAVLATIDSITDADGDFRIILKCDRYYKNMAVTRRAEASIIFSEYKGLVVDAACIALESGTPGVFVKQRSGNFKWVPVLIDEKHSAGTKYIVSAGTYQDENGKTVRTVNYYDEVLKDPKAAGYV